MQMKEMNQSLCIVGKEIWNANIGEMMRIMTLQEAYPHAMPPGGKKQIRKIIFEHFDYIVDQWKIFHER